MSEGRIFKAEAEGLAELQRDLKKAGASLDNLKDANEQVGDVVVPTAKREAPVRSGSLRGSIRAEATPRQAIIAAGNSGVPYAGVIHFGDPYRGLGRGSTRDDLVNTLGSRGARVVGNKRLGRVAARNRRGQRGGPIAPNPYLYRALGIEENQIHAAFERRVRATSAIVDPAVQ